MNKNKHDRLKIILDTTHGINYMPVAAYRATIAAARMISTMFNILVDFMQYNSDPIVGIPPKDMILNIHLVRREHFTPNKAAQRLVYSYLIYNAGHAKLFYRSKELDSS